MISKNGTNQANKKGTRDLRKIELNQLYLNEQLK